MRAALRFLAALALAIAAAAPPVEAGGGARVRIDPNYAPPNMSPGWVAPPPRAPQRRYQAAPSRPVIACDAYGRCWQQIPGYGYRPYGYKGYRYYDNGYRRGDRPPGWADDLPRRAREPDRFFRPRSNVVCDRGSLICYKGNEVDKSETRSVFGDRAADRADDLRDRRGTAELFVPERGVSCDRSRRICYDEGEADFNLTRRYFGERAAGALD